MSRKLFLVLFFLTASGAARGGDDLRVEFVTATVKPLHIQIEMTGTIEALDSVDIGFRQGGRVVEVLVEEGDRVGAGQALARLDPVQQDQALNVAEASLAAARATEEQARQASDRAEAMLSRGIGTRAARDDAAQALSEATGSVERAATAVDQARRAVDETVLRARKASVVTARNIAPGQIVGAAQPVLSLAGLEGLEAVFKAPDHPRLRDAMGRDMWLKPIDIDMPPMTGVVTEIAPLVEPQTGTVTLRARIGMVPGGTALLGAAIQGRLQITATTGIALPWTALMREGAEPAVWVVGEDRRVSLVPVRISQFTDDHVYLSEGVVEGQIVVGDGSQRLYPGRAVVPVEALP